MMHPALTNFYEHRDPLDIPLTILIEMTKNNSITYS